MVRTAGQKRVDEIAVPSMKLNSIKAGLQSILQTLLELLLCHLDVLQSHLFWKRIAHSRHSSYGFSDSDCRRTPHLQTVVPFRNTDSSAVKNLKEYFASLGMDRIVDFFPALHLIFVIETSSSNKASSPETPSCGFGENEPCACPLTIVLLKKRGGDAEINIASFSGQCSHDNSIVECDISHLKLVTPLCLHWFDKLLQLRTWNRGLNYD